MQVTELLHDEKVRAALAKLVDRVDVVVFAQMSMALVEHPEYDVPVFKFGRLSCQCCKRSNDEKQIGVYGK